MCNPPSVDRTLLLCCLSGRKLLSPSSPLSTDDIVFRLSLILGDLYWSLPFLPAYWPLKNSFSMCSIYPSVIMTAWNGGKCIYCGYGIKKNCMSASTRTGRVMSKPLLGLQPCQWNGETQNSHYTSANRCKGYYGYVCLYCLYFFSM